VRIICRLRGRHDFVPLISLRDRELLACRRCDRIISVRWPSTALRSRDELRAERLVRRDWGPVWHLLPPAEEVV
jgi:hypothetical protein